MCVETAVLGIQAKMFPEESCFYAGLSENNNRDIRMKNIAKVPDLFLTRRRKSPHRAANAGAFGGGL